MSARNKLLRSKLSACLRELAEPDGRRRIAALELLCVMSDALTREFAIVSPFAEDLGDQPALMLLAEVISRYRLDDRSTAEQTLLSYVLSQVDSRLVSSDPGYAELSAQHAALEKLLDDETGFTLASDVCFSGQPARVPVRLANRRKWDGLINNGLLSELLQWLLPLLADDEPSRVQKRIEAATFLLEAADRLRIDSVVRPYLEMLERVDPRTRSNKEAALFAGVVVRLFPLERGSLHDCFGTRASACIAKLLADPDNSQLVRDSENVPLILSAATEVFGSLKSGS